MQASLAWDGDAASLVALLRLEAAGADVTLVHPFDPTTRRSAVNGLATFILEEQAASLGLPLLLVRADAPLPARHTPTEDERGAATVARFQATGHRAIVVNVRDDAHRDVLGAFVDAPEAAAILAAPRAHRTLVIEGPRMRRRVDVMAGDTRPWQGGWMLDLGLRGC